MFDISNFVHEVFKTMEEIVIQHAFVIENTDEVLIYTIAK